jgi:hypothetical protein
VRLYLAVPKAANELGNTGLLGPWIIAMGFGVLLRCRVCEARVSLGSCGNQVVLGTRPETYPIPDLTTSQVGLLGLGLFIVAVFSFFKKSAFELT